MTKVCSQCKRELPLNSKYFHRHKAHGDGFHSMCKECRGCKKKVIKEGFKICSKCNENLPLESFNNQKMGYLGKRSYCRKCQEAESDNYRFDGLRKLVLERDKHKCTICGSDNILQVHHIDELGRNTPKEFRNNTMENLITLCVSCHAKQENAFKCRK